MHKLFFFVCLSAILGVSCKKVTTFTIDVNTGFTIPSGSPINLPFDIATPPVSTNASSVFEQEKTRAALVETIALSSCKLNITSPPNREFDFVKEIHVFISTPDQPEVEIAWKTDIDDSIGQELILQTSGINLKPYVVHEQFTLRVHTVTDQVTTSATDVNLNAVFSVKAGLK